MTREDEAPTPFMLFMQLKAIKSLSDWRLLLRFGCEGSYVHCGVCRVQLHST